MVVLHTLARNPGLYSQSVAFRIARNFLSFSAKRSRGILLLRQLAPNSLFITEGLKNPGALQKTGIAEDKTPGSH